MLSEPIGRAPGQLPRGLQPLRVLVEHRVHDVDERLVTVEQAMPAGQQVSLEPALAGVLGQDLHDAAVAGEVDVDGERGLLPGLAGDLEQRVQPVGLGLVRSDDAEVALLLVAPQDVAQHGAEHPRRLGRAAAGGGDRNGVVAEVRHVQVTQQHAAVRVRSRAEPARAGGHEAQDLGPRRAPGREQLGGPVGLQPLLQLAQVRGIGAHLRERNLVRAPRSLHRQPVHLGRPGPALGRAQDDHRPPLAGSPAALAGSVLDGADPPDRGVQGRCHFQMGNGVTRAGHVRGLVAVSAQQRVQLGLGEPGEHGRVGDLPAVQVQDRQHRAVGGRVEEPVRMPAGRQRAGLGLAVADDAGDDQAGVVEGGAVRVRHRVAELAALVDGARRLRRDVTRHAAGEGELAEQRLHAAPCPAARSGRCRCSCLPARCWRAPRDRRGRAR